MRESQGERIFYTINYIVLALLGLSCLFPLVHIAALSLSSAHAINSGFVTIFPVEFTIEAYKMLIKGTPILNAFRNSVIITIVSVVLSMFFTILAAYPLSRKYFYARKYLTLVIVFTMLFNGGLIPTYLIVKGLGLVNTYWALWMTGLISVYNMLVMKTFFQNIPSELEEAARIDGCSELKFLIRIMLPLSMPVLATLSLFYGVSAWNMFMKVLMYINETKKYNLAVLVQQMIRNQSILDEMQFMESVEAMMQVTPESAKAAGVMVMVIPMLLVYPILQKYFVKGVMLGSIKG